MQQLRMGDRNTQRNITKTPRTLPKLQHIKPPQQPNKNTTPHTHTTTALAALCYFFGVALECIRLADLSLAPLPTVGEHIFLGGLGLATFFAGVWTISPIGKGR